MTKITNSGGGKRRAAIVTGSSRGLGREIALRFARGGWNVAVNYFRSADAAQTVAAEIGSLGSESAVVQADVADATTHDMLIGAAMQRWGRLDCLVNNAAIVRDYSVTKLCEGDWDELMSADLFGPMGLARRAAEVMRPGSSIVNVTSICGLWGCGGASAYSAAKAALSGFTSAAAAEFGEKGVSINAIAPGYMATDMGRSAPGAANRAWSQHAMGVLSEPRAAAEFIFQLARMPGISGQVFNADGRIR